MGKMKKLNRKDAQILVNYLAGYAYGAAKDATHARVVLDIRNALNRWFEEQP